MDNNDLIMRLCIVAYELWRSNLVAGPPATHRRFERMDKPVAGDIVMEITAGVLAVLRGIRSPAAIGTLTEITREPYPNWDEAEDGPAPLEEVIYIKRLDNEESVRWTNAKFVTVIPKEGW